MLTVENIETAGWEPALRGMRNPLDSWDRADSRFDERVHAHERPVVLGPNDESLMRRLIRAVGNDHCKFRRMLVIWCDVTAPLYWWKEFDTYKVGTVANSCSTMHTLMDHEFTFDMFSCEDFAVAKPVSDGVAYDAVPPAMVLVDYLNEMRDLYFEAKENGMDDVAEHLWRGIVQLLPEGWNQRRTLMLNYEVMSNIYRARRHHKLREWHRFIDAMVEELPYPWIFTGE